MRSAEEEARKRDHRVAMSMRSAMAAAEGKSGGCQPCHYAAPVQCFPGRWIAARACLAKPAGAGADPCPRWKRSGQKSWTRMGSSPRIGLRAPVAPQRSERRGETSASPSPRVARRRQQTAGFGDAYHASTRPLARLFRIQGLPRAPAWRSHGADAWIPVRGGKAWTGAVDMHG